MAKSNLLEIKQIQTIFGILKLSGSVYSEFQSSSVILEIFGNSGG